MVFDGEQGMKSRNWISALLLGFVAGVVFPLTAAALDVAMLGSYWDMENADAAWGAGAKVGIPVLTDHFELQGRAYWYPDVSANIDKIDFVPVDLGAAIQILPGETFNPSLLAGVSYVFVDSSGRNSIDGDWGAYAGAGLEIGLGLGFVIDTEVLFRFAEMDYSDRFEHGTFDAKGLTANIGLGFRF